MTSNTERGICLTAKEFLIKCSCLYMVPGDRNRKVLKQSRRESASAETPVKRPPNGSAWTRNAYVHRSKAGPGWGQGMDLSPCNFLQNTARHWLREGSFFNEACQENLIIAYDWPERQHRILACSLIPHYKSQKIMSFQ